MNNRCKEKFLKEMATELFDRIDTDYKYATIPRAKAFLAYEFGIDQIEKNKDVLKEYEELEDLKNGLKDYSRFKGYETIYKDIEDKQKEIKFPKIEVSDQDIIEALQRFEEGKYPTSIWSDPMYEEEYNYTKSMWENEYFYSSM